MRAPRRHNTDMERHALSIIGGTFEGNLLVADVTPGGGKTGSATILANKLLDAGKIDSVLWVVPRTSLAEQVIEAFGSKFGSSKGRVLELVDEPGDLFAPSLPNMPIIVGGVTTYQAISHPRNASGLAAAMANRRTLVIFDEVQFLNEDPDIDGVSDKKGWYRRAKIVQRAAAFTLVMSGTLWRTDGKRIPFVPYTPGDAANGEDPSKFYPRAHISYDLRTAVNEQAVLPTEWHNQNGRVEYVYNGVPQSHELLDDGDEEESRKVRAFLACDKVVAGIIDNMVDHWQEWQKKGYHSRFVVMAHEAKDAAKWHSYVERRHNIRGTLATHKTEAAGRKLRHFRERRSGEFLSTVAMAYVGFDCPDLSHLAYLTPTRAPSWMLQSFARVSRYDADAPIGYDRQHAFVFAPDDTRMRSFMSWLRDQQDMGIRDRRSRGPVERVPSEIVLPDDFEPIGATAGSVALESLYRRINPDVEARLADFAGRCPAAKDIPPTKLYEILTSAGMDLSRESGVINGIAR